MKPDTRNFARGCCDPEDLSWFAGSVQPAGWLWLWQSLCQMAGAFDMYGVQLPSNQSEWVLVVACARIHVHV